MGLGVVGRGDSDDIGSSLHVDCRWTIDCSERLFLSIMQSPEAVAAAAVTHPPWMPLHLRNASTLRFLTVPNVCHWTGAAADFSSPASQFRNLRSLCISALCPSLSSLAAVTTVEDALVFSGLLFLEMLDVTVSPLSSSLPLVDLPHLHLENLPSLTLLHLAGCRVSFGVDMWQRHFYGKSSPANPAVARSDLYFVREPRQIASSSSSSSSALSSSSSPRCSSTITSNSNSNSNSVQDELVRLGVRKAVFYLGNNLHFAKNPQKIMDLAYAIFDENLELIYDARVFHPPLWRILRQDVGYWLLRYPQHQQEQLELRSAKRNGRLMVLDLFRGERAGTVVIEYAVSMASFLSKKDEIFIANADLEYLRLVLVSELVLMPSSWPTLSALVETGAGAGVTAMMPLPSNAATAVGSPEGATASRHLRCLLPKSLKIWLDCPRLRWMFVCSRAASSSAASSSMRSFAAGGAMSIALEVEAAGYMQPCRVEICSNDIGTDLHQRLVTYVDRRTMQED